MATRMQQRRGTAAQWTAANPILAAGEIGFETDTNKFKMGNGSSVWSALQYFANAAELQTAINNLVDGAPGALDTLNELAAALGDNPDYFSDIQDTLNLKATIASPEFTGVPLAPTASPATNTTQIATTEFVQTKINNLVNGAPGALDTLQELAAALANDADYATTITNNLGQKANISQLTDHASTTENVHGISDMTDLVNSTGMSTAITNAITTHNSLTTDVHGIPDTSVLVTDSDLAGAVSVVSGDLGTHANLTLSVHGIADTSLLVTQADLENAIDGAEVDQSALAGTGIDWNAVDGRFDIDSTIATTAYADQAEADAITTAAQDATNKANAAVVSAGTEADTKISTAVAALTKSSVGLGNVDNTSDADKPVSTATQTALDAKASLSGAIFTGSVEIDQDLTVDGNLTVNGTTFNASATSITIEDNMVQLAHQNAANTVDLGLVVAYNDGAAKHAGIVRDVSDAKWKLFKDVSTEPSTTVAFGEGSLDTLAVAGLEATTVTVSSGVAFSDGTQTKEGVPSRTPIIQKTAAYTLSALSERDSLIEVAHTGASAVNVTIPADSTLNFPIGTTIDVLQTDTGSVAIAAGAGVTANATPGLTLRTRWSSATLMKRAANTWVVFGDLK